MLVALLLAGIIAAPIASAGLFTSARQRGRAAGVWPAIRRLVLAMVGTVVLAAAVAAVLRLIGATERNLVAAVAWLVFASLVWLPVTRRWNARAHLVLGVQHVLVPGLPDVRPGVDVRQRPGRGGTAGGMLLWAFEVAAAVLASAYLWELCDALGTERWRRRVTASVPLPVAKQDLPFVSLHVPAHNEPPGMVIDTLSGLLRLDYPRYEVVLIDDNTDDEALWRPVEQWCASHGVTFAHLADWPGYKYGPQHEPVTNHPVGLWLAVSLPNSATAYWSAPCRGWDRSAAAGQVPAHAAPRPRG